MTRSKLVQTVTEEGNIALDCFGIPHVIHVSDYLLRPRYKHRLRFQDCHWLNFVEIDFHCAVSYFTNRSCSERT